MDTCILNVVWKSCLKFPVTLVTGVCPTINFNSSNPLLVQEREHLRLLSPITRRFDTSPELFYFIWLRFEILSPITHRFDTSSALFSLFARQPVPICWKTPCGYMMLIILIPVRRTYESVYFVSAAVKTSF